MFAKGKALEAEPRSHLASERPFVGREEEFIGRFVEGIFGLLEGFGHGGAESFDNFIGLRRLVFDYDRVRSEIEEHGIALFGRGVAELPAGVEAGWEAGVFTKRITARAGGRCGCSESGHLTRKFREWEKRGAFDRTDGALGIGIKGADGFDRVAEKLDANRLCRFGREDVDDAAAHGELAGHFTGELAVVAGGDEVIEKILVSDGLVALNGARELVIVGRLAEAPERRLDGHQEEIGFAGGKAPEGDGARF